MNVRPENYNAFIAAKMLGWRQVASCGVDRYEKARARNNLRRLVHNHPDIATECGVNQQRWPPGFEGANAKN